jgi:hypothetical protein
MRDLISIARAVWDADGEKTIGEISFRNARTRELGETAYLQSVVGCGVGTERYTEGPLNL